MIATALRLHASLEAARAKLTAANLASLEAVNAGDKAAAKASHARANGLRTAVGKAASEFRAAADKAVYLHGADAATALKGKE